MRAITTLLALSGLTFLCANAAQLPPDLTLTPIATANEPMGVRHANDGSGRAFIIERAGRIRIMVGTTVQPGNFLDISTLVNTGGERGLLGLAFHPNYSSNGTFYVHYSATNGRHTIARYTVSANPNVANPTGTVIFSSPDLASNHNGGDLHFGPDGYLYASIGDGGPQNDPNNVAQNLWKQTISSTEYFLLGKIIRIDVDRTTPAGSNEVCGAAGDGSALYAIPPSNPFVASANTCDEIWSFGLRNPYRFSFDRLTGAMWIGDVGQSQWEEINYEEPASGGGVNWGWRCLEGNRTNTTNLGGGQLYTLPPCTGNLADPLPSSRRPVLEYDHNGGRCSVTGGYTFRGPIARVNGIHFYADYCSGQVFLAGPGATAGSFVAVPTPGAFPEEFGWIGFGEDQAGNIYAVRQNGQIYRLASEAIFDSGFN